MPRMVKLYFTAKMPAFAQLRICVQMSSMFLIAIGAWPERWRASARDRSRPMSS